MSRPRYRKVGRDLWAARSRVALMVLAIAVSLVGVGALLTARAVVGRETTANYMGTRPASATLDLPGGVDGTLLEQVRARPGVVDAAARRTVAARVRVDGTWWPMLLMVIPADDPLRVSRFELEQGSWPPPDDGLLLERSAVEVVRAGPGGKLTVKTPDGDPLPVTVSGIVHDPSLAPADQERTGYGYLTPAALARLGEPGVLDELKIVVGDGPDSPPARDTAVIDAHARQTADWLEADGHQVHDILVPPPYTHPHQNQAETVIVLFLGFAVAALVLAGLLVATTLGALLAQQVRQIGVLKAIGATTRQVLGTYLLMAVGIAVAATVLSLAPAVGAGMLLTGLVADLLNIDLADTSVPPSVWVVQVGAGLTVPLLIALVPLVRASRITVRQALDRYGVDTTRTGTRRLDRWLTGLRGANRTLLFAARNAVRRRGRLALTLGLLTAGGALFTAGLNTTAAWRGWVDDGLAARAYDLEVRLSGPQPADRVTAALRGVDGVLAVQTTLTMPAAAADPDGGVQVRRTYPDGSHGNFTLAAVPTGTDMLRLAVEEGRWLRASDTDAVVLNQSAALRLGVGRTGDEVTVSVEGKPTRWRVVGLVSEVGGPATGYVTAGALDPVLGATGRATAARIVLDPRAAADEGTTNRVETALAAAGFDVAGAIPTPQLRVAVKEHVLIFVDTLVALAALMAVVGLLGLAVTMGINVTERTREFGVMHAIGATPRAVRRIVLTEGLIVGVIGCLLAIAVSVPLSVLLGRVLGTVAFNLPLPVRFSTGGLLTWTLTALVSAALACLAAARRAGRMTVRDALAYE